MVTYDERRVQWTNGKHFGHGPLYERVYDVLQVSVMLGGAYGIFSSAYYPDKIQVGHKGVIIPSNERGLSFYRSAMFYPMVQLSMVGLTFVTVESFLENVGNPHPETPIRNPWNTAAAGFFAGMVMNGFATRRVDYATVSGIGTALLMACLELNGPSILCEPEKIHAKRFPDKMSSQFEESPELKGLKEKYPKYKNL